ncbi:MAG TPA: hypothetical protein VLZ77_02065 [Acidimicrobiales bacterium]|nr:hypothetical protein [Acidimicrobiales bacterium]
MADRHPDATTVMEHDAVRRERERHGARHARGAAAAGESPVDEERPRAAAGAVPDITLTAARGPAGRVAFVALLVALVGAWGATVAFTGPAMGFSADGTAAWHWDTAHALLWLAPGAAAVLAAVALLGLVPATRGGRGRLGTATAGIAVVACGAWFVIGPVAWPVLHAAAPVFRPARPLRELAFQVVYSLGPGSLLLALGGAAAAWGMRRRAPSSARPVSLVT